VAVHRFKAGESEEVTEPVAKKPSAKTKTAPASAKKVTATPKKEKAVRLEADGTPRRNIFVRITNYFKGSWHELRQVRWPNRKQTWQLTLAVILFSLLIGAVIFGLDALFTWLFKEVIL
jgi:preprotein translocase SecE subunit